MPKRAQQETGQEMRQRARPSPSGLNSSLPVAAAKLPRGKSPVVLVFDDASPSQFRYVERGGKLEIDPTSMIGIWLDFAKTKPDWGNKAVMCMLSGAEAGRSLFGNKGIEGQKDEWRFRKVRFLAEQGFELCNHTLWHAQLSKYPDAFVQEQIARGVMAIERQVYTRPWSPNLFIAEIQLFVIQPWRPFIGAGTRSFMRPRSGRSAYSPASRPPGRGRGSSA